MESIDKIPQSFNVDIIGFTDDMAYLLTSSQERELIPAEYNKLKSHVKEISKEIVERITSVNDKSSIEYFMTAVF